MANKLLDSTTEKILECSSDFGRYLEAAGHRFPVAYERDGWVAVDGGDLIRGKRKEIVFGLLIEGFKESNRDIFDDAVSKIELDPIFLPYIGGMAGTAMSASEFGGAKVLLYCIISPVEHGEVIKLDRAAVLKKISEIESLFTGRTAYSTLLVPIPGITVTLPGSYFELTDKISFGRFSDDEFLACAESGVISPQFPSLPIIDGRSRVGCKVLVPMPIVLTKLGEERERLSILGAKNRRFGAVEWSFAHGIADDILFVMRLVGAGRTVASGTLLWNRSFFGTSFNWLLRATSPWSQSDFVIDQRAAGQMSTLWTALSSNESKRVLPSICIRRFNSAMERQNLDDAIADITIAAEALFLSDNSTEREELGFRLRARAAKLLEINGRHYSRTMKVFSKAYSLRSSIVHGGHIPEKLSLDGEEMTADAFFAIVAELMRESLSIAVEQYSSDSTFATGDYWERLLFERATGVTR